MDTAVIQQTLDEYISHFPDEAANFPLLRKQLAQAESLTSRKNMQGHVTASGVIMHGDRILLIFHNKLKRYIQPGGHVEDGDIMVWQTAVREVREETGIEAILHPWHRQHGNIPFHIDTHDVPANPKRGEGDHFHHDFVYVFQVNDPSVALQIEEVSDFKWVPLDVDFSTRSLKMTVEKIKRLS